MASHVPQASGVVADSDHVVGLPSPREWGPGRASCQSQVRERPGAGARREHRGARLLSHMQRTGCWTLRCMTRGATRVSGLGKLLRSSHRPPLTQFNVWLSGFEHPLNCPVRDVGSLIPASFSAVSLIRRLGASCGDNLGRSRTSGKRWSAVPKKGGRTASVATAWHPGPRQDEIYAPGGGNRR